jgi:hypothetical protein
VKGNSEDLIHETPIQTHLDIKEILFKMLGKVSLWKKGGFYNEKP